MDSYTPDHIGGITFNDYIVSTYLDLSSVRFTYDIWNVHREIIEHCPRTNNHVGRV